MSKYDDLLQFANKRVAKMDKIDGGNVAETHSLERAIRIVMTALETAINIEDWNVACEAQVMLQQLESKYRNKK